MALNCGAVSCPALEYFSSSDVDEMLTLAADAYVSNTVRVEENNVVHLPKILDWYASDFGGSKAEIVKRLVEIAPNSSASAALRSLVESGAPIKFVFTNYDWSIFNRPLPKIEDL